MSADEVVTWLRGVLDETEQVARAATTDKANPPGWGFDDDDPGLWEVQSDEDGSGHFRRASVFTESGITVADMADPNGNEPTATHIARHDPRAILARVEAERALIEIDNSACDDIVRWLAYGHRFDAQGWREEWAPEAAP